MNNYQIKYNKREIVVVNAKIKEIIIIIFLNIEDSIS